MASRPSGLLFYSLGESGFAAEIHFPFAGEAQAHNNIMDITALGAWCLPSPIFAIPRFQIHAVLPINTPPAKMGVLW